MNYNRDFKLFARDYGVGTLTAEQYIKGQTPSNITPYILEERQLNVTQMDIFSRMMKDRIIFFNEDFRDDNMGVISAQYLFLNSLSDDPIKMYLNSPGGGCIAGLSLIDTIMSTPPRFEPTVMGLAASMGSVLGTLRKIHKDDDKDVVTRRMLKHSRIMIHDVRGGTQGTYLDQEISLRLTKELREELFTLLASNSKLTPQEVQDYCNRDYWMKSDKALEFGFVDEIIQYL